MADVVAGLLLRDGKALLGLRKPGKRGGLWEMPGGKVDERHVPHDNSMSELIRKRHETALQREWREECGVDIDVGERIATALLDVEVCFTVTLYSVHVINNLEPKALDHVELRWVDLYSAIETWPCSSAMYMHWPFVRSWLRQRALLVEARATARERDTLEP
jgi:8-oxo-dGTP pyrophosphatase MutT (NUDIX family)